MNLLLFLILESVSMFVLICCKNMAIIFSKSVGDFFIYSNSFILHWKKTFQEILYTTTLIIFLPYIRSKSGNYGSWRDCCVFSWPEFKDYLFLIVSFCLYDWETRHSRHDIGNVWETWGYKFASIHHFNPDIVMLHIAITPLRVGI